MALVLIVDDSPTEQHVFCQALERNGHETIVANDGEEAIEMAVRAHPEVIVMDVVMPGMNGFQATRRLSKDPASGIIMTSRTSLRATRNCSSARRQPIPTHSSASTDDYAGTVADSPA